MSDAGGSDKTYTQDEVDALIRERNEALEAKRDEILGELKAARDKLKAYDGVDADEHKALKAKVADLEHKQKADKAGITSDQLEKLRADIREDLEREYADIVSERDSLSSEVRGLRLDSVVKAEMGKAGVRPERIDALFRLNADAFDLTDDGSPMLKDRPGIGIDKYVAEDLKKLYPEFYQGSGSSGGGASKSAAGGGGAKQITYGDQKAFSDNLEAIARGEVEVAVPQ